MSPRSCLFLVILTALAMLVSSCRNDIAEIKAWDTRQNLPVQTTYEAEFTYTDQGRKTNVLHAHQLDRYEGEKSYFEALGGFELQFFDSLQQKNAVLTARHGWFYEQEKRLIARDSVELFNVRGERLETSELIFAQDSGRIYTDKFVKITLEDGSTLHGMGLESNESFTKYKIKRPHEGELYVEDKKQAP
ncbi:MAG: LPS export ABC transporter periplasmic protein LptC [Flavobacteriales bacterium]|nr:LPS export ABC transporter periplasmic protein LptC [Flavobacteriales bacterium]